MERKTKISLYREKLDKTLASSQLTKKETLKTLIRSQLLSSSQQELEECKEHSLDKKTIEVFNFLDELRSASLKEHEVSKSNEAAHGDWKLKQDTKDLRVMYREGAQGTPFHTLLVEGYVDGPVDACLCISWESSLYKKWWPQSVFPSFKVTQSKCLQKARIDEQICLVRMKVPWPLKDREAVIHYFLFEYFQDDLIVVLLNSVSNLESIEKSTYGFTKNGIAEAQDAVMIDLIGGFALQKVTSDRSYFRTIAALDLKLDLMPPSLLNFIARQLIGNGFRLYQKAVASVSESNKDYSKVLGEPLYIKIREALYHTRKPDEAQEEQELKTESLPKKEPDEECINNIQQKLHNDESLPRDEPGLARKAFGEIEEEENEANMPSEEDAKGNNVIAQSRTINSERLVRISPEVERALGTLQKVISKARKYRLDAQGKAMPSPSSSDEKLPPHVGNGPMRVLTSPGNMRAVSDC